MAEDDLQPTPTVSDVMSTHDQLLARGKLILAKRRADWQHQRALEKHGPQPEYVTKAIYSNYQLIPLAKILDDPNFTNFRQYADPGSLENLQTSIGIDGLRTPITVVEAAAPGYYHVRAGFRRTMAVRNLHWKEIPAIVLPSDIPEKEEYWTNIIENTNRDQLSSYETAFAAKWMRDEFNVTGAEFARKTGVDPGRVYQLLGCIDRLPPEVLQSWKNGTDRVPFHIYEQLSRMSPLEAIKNLRLWKGQHRISPPERQAAEALERLQTKRKASDKLWTVRGLERTQRLIMAIKVSNLSEEEKRRCIDVVEYCQGCRQRIPGIVNDRRLPSREFEIPGQDHLDAGIAPTPEIPESKTNEVLDALNLEVNK